MLEQNITVFEVFEFFGLIIMGIGGFYAIRGAARKERERFETKENSKLKFDAMDQRVSSIEKEVEDNKKDNQREHDSMKKDLKEHIDVRMDDLKDFIGALINKSA